MLAILKDIFAFRTFISSSVVREIRTRYANTLLGPVWVFVQPLMMISIYTLVFSRVMHSKLPGQLGDYAYSIHLCAGLLPWMFFSDLLNKLQGMYVENGNLLKKMHFPRGCLSAIAIGSSLFTFLVIFCIFLLFSLWVGNFPVGSLGYFPLILLLQIMLTLAIGHFLAVANVYFRDVGHMVNLVLQLAFWFTPIVYPFDVLPAWVKNIIQINPFVGIMRFYQTIFMQNTTGSWFGLLPALAWMLLFLLLAIWAERTHGKNMVDEL